MRWTLLPVIWLLPAAEPISAPALTAVTLTFLAAESVQLTTLPPTAPASRPALSGAAPEAPSTASFWKVREMLRSVPLFWPATRPAYRTPLAALTV